MSHQTKTVKNTRILAEGAMMIALSFVLSFLTYSGSWLQGGSISLEIIPIIIMGLRNGPKWGVATGFVAGVLQLIMGFSNVMYCPTLATQIGCVLLDYVVAFSVLGLARPFAKMFANKSVGVILGTVIAGLLRFVCHYISGIWLWGEYAPEGQPVWLYSLTYNGTYMAVNIIMATVIIAILYNSASKQIMPEMEK
ncbi:MAG: energy-coupled thiamine transporter ThiT [Ruminococcaceae bacterium]|nr:energy-coupled thiamine transporter ThiT [Oscillospiraceae bacterium]